MALIAESGLRCDFGQTEVTIREKVHRKFDAALNDKLVNGSTGRRFESCTEVRRTQPRNNRKLVQGKILSKIIVDVVDDRAQPPLWNIAQSRRNERCVALYQKRCKR